MYISWPSNAPAQANVPSGASRVRGSIASATIVVNGLVIPGVGHRSDWRNTPLLMIRPPPPMRNRTVPRPVWRQAPS